MKWVTEKQMMWDELDSEKYKYKAFLLLFTLLWIYLVIY